MIQNKAVATFLMAAVALLQVLSPVLFVPGGQAFGASFFRILVFSVALIIYFRHGISFCSKLSQNFLICNISLIFWLFLSLSWSYNYSEGLKQIAYFSTILSITYVFLYFNSRFQDLRRSALIVSIIGFAIIITSLYEIETGVHFFRSSLLDASELDRSLSYIAENQAWFTFGNPNDLAVHLAICCIASSIFMQGRWFFVFYCVPVFYVSDVLDSRIVSIAIVLFFVMYLGFRAVPTVRAINTVSLLVGGVGAIAALALLINADQVEFLDVSSFVRLQLIRSAFEMAQRTVFLGIGAGGFEGEMWSGGYIAGTYGITNPHNAFGRMLAEGGVVGLTLLILMLFSPLVALRKVRGADPMAAPVASAMLVMPLLMSVGSDPASSSSLQLAVALLVTAAQLLETQGGASHAT